MSGIVGFTFGSASRLRNNANRVLGEMQGLITHQDFYVKDELFCDGYVCATRSHLNISQKRQQPYHELGMYVWLDGEFYNQGELCEQLVPVNSNDLELLLKLFLKSNGDFRFLEQIDGTYSAVIYDSNQKKIHLITDALGLRQLYWIVRDGCLVWGSEVKAMLALPNFHPKIDSRALDEFLSVGHLLGDRTWFEGVELLPSGTVLTWDIKQRSIKKQRYWWWDEIRPLAGRIDEGEVVEELGRLFIDAVNRRSRQGERVGLKLSGGCDSRAVLAAMPERGYPIHAVTFGKKGCEDIRIAGLAARARGATHHVVEINRRNWFILRVRGVWKTDGHLELLHMHDIGALPELKERFDILLSGRLASLSIGASYLGKSHMNEIQKIQNRGRRFIKLANETNDLYLASRSPFTDNNLVRFSKAIPIRLRRNAYIYHKMLLNTFPQYFRTIPWEAIGVPISWPTSIVRGIQFSQRVKQKLLRELSRVGFQDKDRHNYADYTTWIRQEPARSFFGSNLNNPKALYPEFISRERVLTDWENHLKGWNRAAQLSRYLTLEIWLQQVFEGKYRQAEEVSLLLVE